VTTRLCVFSTASLVLWCVGSVYCAAAHCEDRIVQETRTPEARMLMSVTGVHSVQHRRAKVSVRLIEEDGSSTVALDPVTLFLVVVDHTLDDGVAVVWRLPRGVERVLGLSATSCGVTASVEVAGGQRADGTVKTERHKLQLCFLSESGDVERELRMIEIPVNPSTPAVIRQQPPN